MNRATKYKPTARVVITDECNRSCEFCCMKDEQLSDTFKEVTPMYVANAHYDVVSITGGEPTLDMHKLLMFVSLLKYRKPDTIVYVYTNGDLLTREEADMMKMSGIDGINWSPKRGVDNYQQNHWAFIHSCVLPVRVLIQDTLVYDDLIQYFDNQGMEFREWTLGETCHEREDEDRYRLRWRD